MTINYKRQNLGDNNCGQCCIAMVLDKTVNEIIELFGKTGMSYTKSYREQLSKNGYEEGRFNPIGKKELYKFSLLRVLWDTDNRHLILHQDGLIYDPAYGVMPLDRYKEFISKYGKIVSQYKLIK